MDDLTPACADLAALFPRLADALTRDNAPPGHRSVLSAGGVVNADVLHAMLTLSHEIPEAAESAAAATGETWAHRDTATSLRALPRLHERLAALSLPNAAARIEDDVRRWMRMTKLALGLRIPDVPIGYDCPYHRDQPAALILLGAEGFIRDDMTVYWQYDGRIWCHLCRESWPADRWLMLGRMLEAG